jgi:putative peptide zinc metalloprotease protein
VEPHPKLRPDLSAYPQTDRNGKKTIILKDPVSGKYYRLSDYEFTFLKTFDGNLTCEDAVEKLKTAGHYYSLPDGRSILGKAAELGLLLGTRFGTAPFQAHLKSRIQKAKRTRLLSSVYFLFIPVLNPDRFLERTLWAFNLIANKWTAFLVILAAPGSIYLIIDALPRIELGYLFFFNWHNLLFLWVTIALVKLVHEFAHAYVAKGLGLHVPEMGIAFLIFFPCLYCNTTEAWQLASPRQRASIAAAGIVSEAVLAVFSAYFWYYSQPGLVNSLAFYLMAVSFGSTILFNGNPLLKFDGYFMLIDLLGMPNLATNSLRYVKYLFMNRVMGNSLVPNPARTQRDGFIFSVYGPCAFVYRVFLYTGLAVGVYYRFDKVLGIILALMAVGLFIVRPLFMGIRTLYRSRREIHPNPAGFATFCLIGLAAVALLCVPWSSKSVYPCFVTSRKIQKLTVPLHTQVRDVFIREGTCVRKGDLLFQLDTSLLKLKLHQAELERSTVEKEIQLMLLDEKLRSGAERKEVELRLVQDKINMLNEQLRLASESIAAPFDSVVTNVDYRLQRGFQPGEGVVVGELQSQSDRGVNALVPATDIHKIGAGQEVEIRFPIGTGLILRNRIDSVRTYSEVDLQNSPFSSRFGGELATEIRGDQQKDAPLEAQYCCSVNLTNQEADTLPLGMSGRLAVQSPPKSLVMRFIDNTIRTFNRETLL